MITLTGDQVDPAALTKSQRECLRFVASWANVTLIGREWGLRGAASRFQDTTVKALIGARLIRKALVRGHWQLEITGSGKFTVAVMDQRSQRRQA